VGAKERTGVQRMIKSSNFEPGVSGFSLPANGNFEASGGIFRGHLEAESGTFKGHVEAESGFFKGELEAGPLISNKPNLAPGPTINYAANTAINTIMSAEFSRLGISTGVNPVSIDQVVTGTFNNKALKNIYIFDQGHGGAANISGIKFTFSDNTKSNMYLKGTNLPGALSFSYSTGEWLVKILNLPGTDPHIAGALYHQVGVVKVSFG
jgi:hypothetical protein